MKISRYFEKQNKLDYRGKPVQDALLDKTGLWCCQFEEQISRCVYRVTFYTLQKKFENLWNLKPLEREKLSIDALMRWKKVARSFWKKVLTSWKNINF